MIIISVAREARETWGAGEVFSKSVAGGWYMHPPSTLLSIHSSQLHIKDEAINAGGTTSAWPCSDATGGFLPETFSVSFSHLIGEALDTPHRTWLPPLMLLSGKCPVLLLRLCRAFQRGVCGQAWSRGWSQGSQLRDPGCCRSRSGCISASQSQFHNPC